MLLHAFVHCSFHIQSEAEVKAQKQQLSKKGTPTSPPKPAAREGAADVTQQSSSTAEHSSQPVASPDGLRQRPSAASNSPNNMATSSNTNNFSSMVPPAARQSAIPTTDALTPVPSRGWGSLFLMWVLLISIVLLVARRIFLTYYGSGTTQSM